MSNLVQLSPPARAKTKIGSSRSGKKIPFVERPRTPVRPQTANRSRNYVPPLVIPLDAMEKFENTGKNNSNSIYKLTETTIFSSPRSINRFISMQGVKAVHIQAAMVIKKAWKRYIYLSKLKILLEFINSTRQRKLRYTLLNWALLRWFPANRSKKYYQTVFSYLFQNGFIIPKTESSYMTKDKKYNVLTVDQYMKSGFVQMHVSLEPEKILKFQRLIFMNYMRRVFSSWTTIAFEHSVYNKSSFRAKNVQIQRENFGPQLWTYFVWKRWTKYRKTHTFPSRKYIQTKELYIPEWSNFRAKKLAIARQNKKAQKMRNNFIATNVLTYMHQKLLEKKNFDRATAESQKTSNMYLMQKCYRAFNTCISFTRMDMGIKRRVLRAWYSGTDQGIMVRMKKQVIRNRSDLQIMLNYFRGWRQNIVDEGIIVAYLHGIIMRNEQLFKRIVFLLTSDLAHYFYMEAFKSWKNIIQSKKRAKMFLNWSMNYSKEDAFRRYLFDILKENAGIASDRTKYLPFRLDGEKGFLMMRTGEGGKLTTRAARRRKLEKALSKPVNGYIMKFFTNTTKGTIEAMKNTHRYQMVDPNWHETATTDQVRNLLFHIIIGVANKRRLLPVFQNQEQKLKAINDFRAKELLYTQINVSAFRAKQDASDANNRKKTRAQIQRDTDLLLALETHDAAVELSKCCNKFSIDKEKGTTRVKKVILDDKTEDTSARNSIKHRHSIKSKSAKSEHPLLQTIDKLKSDLNNNNRKYRRSPNDIFVTEARSKKVRTIRPTLEGEKSTEAVMYEMYVPIRHNVAMQRKMSSREFVLKDLQCLHEKAETEIETIPEEKELFTEEEEEVAVYQPPKLEELPTIATVPTKPRLNLQDELKSTLSQSQAIIDVVNSSRSLSRDSLRNGSKTSFNLSNVSGRPQLNTIEEDLSSDISIDQLSKNFVNDDGYFEFDEKQRSTLLTNKYFTILDLVLGGSQAKPRHPDFRVSNSNIATDFPSLQTRISKMLRKLLPPPTPPPKKPPKTRVKSAGTTELQVRREKKKERKKLFDDPDKTFEVIKSNDGKEYQKSACPEFANVLFDGQTVLTNSPWEHHKNNSTSPPPPKVKDTYQALPTASHVVQGFDDVPLNIPLNIPGGETLLEQVENYLQKSSTDVGEFNVSDDEEIIELLQEAAKNTSNAQLKAAIMRLIDRIVHRIMLQQVDKMEEKDLDKFVDLDEVEASEEIHSTEQISPEEEYIKQFQFAQKPKHKAFDTEYRGSKYANQIILERRFTFTSDLLNSIKEGAQFASPYIMRYYKDINKIKPYTNMKKLRNRIMKKVFNRKRTEPEEPRQTHESDVVFSAAGYTQRMKPQKIKPTVTKVNKKREVKEIPLLQIDSRPQTEVKERLYKVPLVADNRVMKRKPRPTKMEPVIPPEPVEFEFQPTRSMKANKRAKTALTPRKALELTAPIEDDEPLGITEEDVDFFMFCTPYVVPPELLERLLDEADEE